MPAAVRKGNSRNCPWEIYNKDTGGREGCSDTEEEAQSSANARNAARHGWKPTGKKRRVR